MALLSRMFYQKQFKEHHAYSFVYSHYMERVFHPEGLCQLKGLCPKKLFDNRQMKITYRYLEIRPLTFGIPGTAIPSTSTYSPGQVLFIIVSSF